MSAYERSAKRPNPRTVERLLAAIDASNTSQIHQRHLLTTPAAAAALRRGLRDGWSTADLLRIVRQLGSDATHLESEADRRAFTSEPSTTGDRRWDLLLAGAVEDLALRRGWPVPEWVRSGSLDSFWFVGSARSLDAYAFARVPLSLQLRGIVLDPADLVAV